MLQTAAPEFFSAHSFRTFFFFFLHTNKKKLKADSVVRVYSGGEGGDSDTSRNGNEEREKRGRQTDERAEMTENRYVARKQTRKQTRGKRDRRKAAKQKREERWRSEGSWNTVPLILYELFIDELRNNSIPKKKTSSLFQSSGITK